MSQQNPTQELLRLFSENPNPDLMCLNNLLTQGADINARGCDGRTPLDIAIHNKNNIETVRHLVEHGAVVEPDILTRALNLPEQDIINYLLQNGASTYLYEFMMRDKPESIDLLVNTAG